MQIIIITIFTIGLTIAIFAVIFALCVKYGKPFQYNQYETEIITSKNKTILLPTKAKSKKQDSRPYWTKRHVKKKEFLTPAEKEFKTILEQNLPKNIEIHCKVRLADILKEETTYRRLIMMHIDFVLLDKKTQDIILAIELDDQSHNKKKAMERDKLKNQALEESKIPYIRIPNYRKYDPEIIERIVTYCHEQT